MGGEIGGIVGTAVQAVVPIPGIGAVIGMAGSFIGGLFGPGIHTTPGGETYDAARYELTAGYFQLMDLSNQIRSMMGLPAAPTIGFIGLGNPGCDAKPDDGTVCAQCSSANCGAVNAPLTGPYLAKLLGNPAYASATSEMAVTNLQKQGVFDAGIQAQDQIIQHLQFVLQSLESGLFKVVNGSLVASSEVAPPDYNSQQEIPSTEPATSYASTQAVAPAPPFSPDWPVIAGVGLVGLFAIFVIREI